MTGIYLQLRSSSARTHALRRLRLLLIFVLCAVGLGLDSLPVQAQATTVGTGTPETCTAEALQTALQGGGIVMFECGPNPVTINLSDSVEGSIAADTIIIGKLSDDSDPLKARQRLITLSGGGKRQILAVQKGFHLTVRNLNFIDGVSDENRPGGAILNDGGVVKIFNSTFTHNRAYAEGGAIVNRLGGSLTIDHSIFTGNLARTVGGAIYSIQGGLLTINYSTFANNLTQSETGSGNGGAIYADGTPFKITWTTFLGNSTSGSGGAISGGEPGIPSIITHSIFSGNLGRQGAGAIANFGLLTLDQNTFTNNSAPTSVFASGSGGAGAIANSGVLTLRRSRFFGNLSFGNGGALRNDGGTVVVSDTTFANNRSLAGLGGAISNFTNTPTTTLTIERTLFDGNSAGLGGGALFNRGNATIGESTFSHNAALLYGADISDTLGLKGASGGAILNGGSGGPRRLDITRSTFIRNSAIGGPNSAGGAIANSTTGAVTIGNSTFVYNAAFQSGGALYQQLSATSMEVQNTTLVDNSAAEGVSLDGAIAISNSIITNGFGLENCSKTLAPQSPNLEFPGHSCGASLQVNPRLGDLGKHGGRTDNYALLDTSQAIDAGDPNICALPLVANIDQRGHLRSSGNGCDLGSYEHDISVLPSSTNDQSILPADQGEP